MNFLNKMERKFGKYAIHNLMKYIIILYVVGFLIQMINPSFYFNYLSLNAGAILRGQVWRIVTFLIQPPDASIIFIFFALYLYYMIGESLEREWGAFKFNAYFFLGVISHVLAALVMYFITGRSYLLDTTYLNLSLFFAFAAVYPNVQFLLFFIIPVKVKYLAWLNGALFLYSAIQGTTATRICVIMSLLNFLVFFLATRNYKKISPKEMHRKQVYRKQMNRQAGISRHKCAICGRTEEDGANLEFRFCSKCQGNYEYCQDHLFTHVHITK